MEARYPSLQKDFAWALSGNLVYSICQWTLLIAVVRLGSSEQAGEYALGIAMVTPILLFCNLQLRALVSSDVQQHYTFEEYLGFRLATLGAAACAVLLMLGLGHHTLHVAGVILLIAFAQSLELLSDFYYGVMQRHGRMDRISHSLMMKGPLALTALGISMYFSRNVLWAVAALVMARAAVVLFYDSSLHYRKDLEPELTERNKPRCSLKMMALLFRKSLPLGLISTLLALIASVPPYFIAGQMDKHALGIFAALYSLQGAGNLVMAALGQSAFVSLAMAFSSKDAARFRALLLRLRCVALGLAVAGIMASAFIGGRGLSLLFRPEYGAHAGVLVRLMVAGGFGYLASCHGYALTAMQRLTPQLFVLCATAVTALVACFVCIPRAGLNGAANACIITAFAQFVGSGLVLARETTHHWRTRPDAETVTAVGGVLAKQASR